MEQPKAPLLLRILALPIRIAYILTMFVFRMFQLIHFSFVRLFSPSKLLRKGNTLYMPVVTLHHSWTNNNVVLFGMMHIGKPEYYDEVQRCVDVLERSGYSVLYEMIKKSSEEELSTLTKKEQKVLKSLRAQMETVNKVRQMLRLASQKEAMVIGPTWQNTDITMVELVRKLAQNTTIEKESHEFEESNEPMYRYIFGLSILWIDSAFMHLLKKESRDVLRDEIILGGRNEVAVTEIVRNSSKNVVALWGAAHLSGIVKTLVDEYEYEVVERKWIPAFTRNYFLRDAVRDMNRGPTTTSRLRTSQKGTL